MADNTESNYDLVVVGAGIVGASTALQYMQRFPEHKVLLIEKESTPAKHQTGRNSGVIHAGVYYAPGSLKADFCRRGLKATIEFCQKHEIPYDQCGKLIVATNTRELPKLENLYSNSIENGLEVSWVEQDQLKIIEPNINGIRAFLVKDSAITNYTAITNQMLANFQDLGGQVNFDTAIEGIEETGTTVEISTTKSKVASKFLIACAGLQADRLVEMMGVKPSFQIIPFKGEYYKLPASKNDISKHLIYPVPDPDMPFLGVHLTNMIDGSVTVGPNAVLSFKREGYKKLAFSLRDSFKMFSFLGFWKVIFANLSSGVNEMKNSLYKRGYLKLIKRYCSSIELEDLEYHPPGIRAQAVMNNGDLVADFLFESTARSLHVCNAPSPAATSAIPIGEHICDAIEKQMAEFIA